MTIESTRTQRPAGARVGSRRVPAIAPLEDDERQRLDVQTRRNLDAMELEEAGRTDLAIALYEQNVAEGFPGDWPYTRLAGIYERTRRYDDAVRILGSALAATKADRRRPAADRRTTVQAIQGRIRTLKKTIQQTKTVGTKAGKTGRSVLPLPMID
jgi:tetratricopeptide (TPR) repeat protein